jgi:bifunctional DNA-binding transcriptional regulator/antitoxin component of YhaV-PrlF toxin-antitoxin module
MTSRRKPAVRTVNTQFNVRVPDEVRERFVEMVDSLKAVQRAGGGALTRTDLVRYWLVWMMRLGPEERLDWARAYRDAYREHVDEVERKGGNPGHAAEMPQAALSDHRGPSATWPLDNGLAHEQDEPAREVEPLPKRRRRKKV